MCVNIGGGGRVFRVNEVKCMFEEFIKRSILIKVIWSRANNNTDSTRVEVNESTERALWLEKLEAAKRNKEQEEKTKFWSCNHRVASLRSLKSWSKQCSLK
jgi:hypothetical protein